MLYLIQMTLRRVLKFYLDKFNILKVPRFVLETKIDLITHNHISAPGVYNAQELSPKHISQTKKETFRK